MGTIALFLILVMDSKETMIQERFETVELCEQGAQQIRQQLANTSYIKYRNHTCVQTAQDN